MNLLDLPNLQLDIPVFIRYMFTRIQPSVNTADACSGHCLTMSRHRSATMNDIHLPQMGDNSAKAYYGWCTGNPGWCREDLWLGPDYPWQLPHIWASQCLWTKATHCRPFRFRCWTNHDHRCLYRIQPPSSNHIVYMPQNGLTSGDTSYATQGFI